MLVNGPLRLSLSHTDKTCSYDFLSHNLPSASNDLVLPSAESNPMSLYNQDNSEFSAKFAVPIIADSICPSLIASNANRKTSIPLIQLLSYAQLGPTIIYSTNRSLGKFRSKLHLSNSASTKHDWAT